MAEDTRGSHNVRSICNGRFLMAKSRRHGAREEGRKEDRLRKGKKSKNQDPRYEAKILFTLCVCLSVCLSKCPDMYSKVHL